MKEHLKDCFLFIRKVTEISSGVKEKEHGMGITHLTPTSLGGIIFFMPSSYTRVKCLM